MRHLIAALFLVILFTACAEKQNENPQKDSEEVAMLKEKINKFVPVEIKYDETLLTDREKVVLENFIALQRSLMNYFLSRFT